MSKKSGKKNSGQAVTELIVILPVLFFMIIFGLQIFASVYEAQVKQDEARRIILTQINNRANGGMGMAPRETYELRSSPVQTLGLPVFGLPEGQTEQTIRIKIGLCRNMNC